MSVNIEITNKKMFPTNENLPQNPKIPQGKPPTNPNAFRNVTNENVDITNRIQG